MTPQPTAALAGQVRPVPPEARHRHDSVCFWDVDECRWQCVTYPGVRNALEGCTVMGRPATVIGPETRP